MKPNYDKSKSKNKIKKKKYVQGFVQQRRRILRQNRFDAICIIIAMMSNKLNRKKIKKKIIKQIRKKKRNKKLNINCWLRVNTEQRQRACKSPLAEKESQMHTERNCKSKYFKFRGKRAVFAIQFQIPFSGKVRRPKNYICSVKNLTLNN